MDRTALNKSLHWSAKEATLGSHRMEEVFEQLDRQEIELMEAVWVDMVRRVVTPSATLAGTALGSSQKLTQDTMTSMQPGT